MNYQTGTATDFNALLNNLDTFLIANGWTQNLKAVQGAGQRAHYQKACLHGTIRVNFRSFIKELPAAIWDNNISGVLNTTNWNLNDGLAMYLSNTFSAGTAWSIQSGRARSGNDNYDRFATQIWGEGNIPAYYFFQRSNPELVVVVVQFALGFYGMLMFGELDKTGAGSYTGGQFYTGTSNQYAPGCYYGGVSPYYGWPDPDGMYRTCQHPFTHYTQIVNINNSTNLQHCMFLQLDPALHGGIDGWLGPQTNNTTTGTYTGSGAYATVVSSAGAHSPNIYTGYPQFGCPDLGSPFRKSANAANLVTAFLPLYMFWQSAALNNGQWRFLGTIPDAYMVNFRDLTPQQIITLGSDQFIALPFNQKQEPFYYDPIPVNSKYLRNYGAGLAIKNN